ncbi:hypothetical protein KAH37_06770, partial [bacterium]|nr:hypothetical protein [bacterium]
MRDGTAWVAIDGVVYDVTHNKSWCCGSHHGIKAGQDLTERIKKSPHGTKTLANLPIIGKLDDGTAPKLEPKPAPAPAPAPVAAPVVEPVVEPKVEPQPAPQEAPVVETQEEAKK